MNITTSRCKSKSVLIGLVSSLMLLVSACTAPVASPLKLAIKAPTEVENGNFVPFQITFSRPLASGEVLTVMAGNEMVCTIKPSGGIVLSAFSGRARMLRSGALQALVIARDGGKIKVAEQVSVTRGATIPASGVSGNSHKIQIQGNELLIVFVNDMGRTGFIESATITLADGQIQIHGSPLLAENPQLSFKTPNSLKKVEVTAVTSSR